ncbi:hypothetical protein TELCIR_07022 [Teladorsagia circumcincta]|uniref:Trehalase n=1 Tax=Teladorsagia circumcincta TaxID=45464 RepID=A0A2G9ULE2_TELCI|nr:hypothetical protein TELCIR_07022 [Teladorsagia circumcincta]
MVARFRREELIDDYAASQYNVIGDYPRPGHGGEYDVQDGFGWTNGVILDLLVTYNDRLRV